MSPAELLERLEAEGVGVTLVLDLEADAEPKAETLSLIHEHRDSLLRHLARELVGGESTPRDLLEPLLVWAAQHTKLRLEHALPPDANGDRRALVLNAKPRHVIDALERHPWGVVYDQSRAVLFFWGGPPDDVLQYHPVTGQPFIPEPVAA